MAESFTDKELPYEPYSSASSFLPPLELLLKKEGLMLVV